MKRQALDACIHKLVFSWIYLACQIAWECEAFPRKAVQEGIYMVKHVILWQLKDELSDSEKKSVKAGIKEGLEGLKGQIEGLVEIQVNTNGLASSNADVMLDSTFVDEAALKGYAVHPAHVAVADGKVRPYTKSRVCLDYEV